MYSPVDLRNQMNLIAFLMLASLGALELFPFFQLWRTSEDLCSSWRERLLVVLFIIHAFYIYLAMHEKTL